MGKSKTSPTLPLEDRQFVEIVDDPLDRLTAHEREAMADLSEWFERRKGKPPSARAFMRAQAAATKPYIQRTLQRREDGRVMLPETPKPLDWHIWHLQQAGETYEGIAHHVHHALQHGTGPSMSQPPLHDHFVTTCGVHIRSMNTGLPPLPPLSTT